MFYLMKMYIVCCCRFRAVYKYNPQNEDELELAEGDVVMVMEKCDDGWFVGTSERTKDFGTFPGNYVLPLWLVDCECTIGTVLQCSMVCMYTDSVSMHLCPIIFSSYRLRITQV